jgi:hypothetical protein
MAIACWLDIMASGKVGAACRQRCKTCDQTWPPKRMPEIGQISKRDRKRSRPTVMLFAWVYSWIASEPCSRPIPLIL